MSKIEEVRERIAAAATEYAGPLRCAWIADDLRALLDHHARLQAQPAPAIDLEQGLRGLYRAYVRLLESGRDRIMSLGGDCDPVDVMEQSNIDLRKVRELLALIDGQANQQTHVLPAGWRVIPHSSPWREGERWEVYGPNSGGSISTEEIQEPVVRDLLDALAGIKPTKSKRVRAAIHRQCQGWLAGTWRGRIRNGKDPQWLRETADGWEVVAEREAALRTALDMFHGGHGAVHIMRHLTSQGLSITASGKNLSTHFYKMIRNRALIGEKVIEIDSTEYRLPGYYPALLSEAEFAQLQASAVQRKGKKVAGEIPHLFTGMGITRCGYCGEAVVSQNMMTRKRDAQGRPLPGHRRLICAGYSHALGCPVAGSCSVVPIEHAVMAYCSDQINLTRLLEPTSAGQGLAAQLALARADVEATTRQIDRITEALTADDAPAPAAFLRRARELEATLAEKQATVAALEHQQTSHSHAPTPAAAAAWAALREGVHELDYDSRVQARQLIADTFSRIAIYHRGIEPDPADTDSRRRTGNMGLLLVTHAGGSRLLHIERRTGKLLSSEDYSPQLPLPPGME